MTAINHAIHKIIADRTNAIRQKDIEKVLSFYSKDVRTFDIVGLLEYKGLEAVRERLTDWFAGFRDGPIGFDIEHILIETEDAIACCSSLNHVQAYRQDGTLLSMWWRETTCYRKMDEQWLIVHAHDSVTFDVATGSPSLNLKPDK
jgi:uncharacterized protein (TIGR02246 family)